MLTGTQCTRGHCVTPRALLHWAPLLLCQRVAQVLPRAAQLGFGRAGDHPNAVPGPAFPLLGPTPLNSEQRAAVLAVLAGAGRSGPPFVLFGPPGESCGCTASPTSRCALCVQ